MALVFVRRFRLLVALSVQTNTAMGPLQIFALLQQPHQKTDPEGNVIQIMTLAEEQGGSVIRTDDRSSFQQKRKSAF
jgi:hypothetical protein